MILRTLLTLALGCVCLLGHMHSAFAQAPALTKPVDAGIPDALSNYVGSADDVYEWEVTGEQQLPQCTVHNMRLVSQTWQSIVWTHDLQVFEPAEVAYPQHAILFINGGRNGRKPGPDDTQMGVQLATLAKARVAILHQVPNQPLLGEHYEDDLITETWLKYLETGDETWPLLFPMVKSAVRAMDAIQEVSAKEWGQSIDRFVITGASKRGWTSWLAPVADKRIVATAPIVIDVLNFRAQMKHQIDVWGDYSVQINDYTQKGLIVTGEESPREEKLRVMMDPYTYRGQLQIPKLIINGTNDPYWVVDAMRWYWDDLKGPKYILQVPNDGHGLKNGGAYALSTVAAFFQHVASEAPLPAITWRLADAGGSKQLQVSTNQTPVEAKLWFARSEDQDFRDDPWESQMLTPQGAEIVATLPTPASHVASYVELKFVFSGVPYSLCTRIYSE